MDQPGISRILPELPPGTIIEGLRIEDVLGRGGMGTIYRAVETASGKLLAIKVLNPERAADRRAIQRFEREARVLGKIRHPNIVEIYAIGRLPDGRCYYTMEYLDGLSLRQQIRWFGRMSLDEALPILAQVADGLDAAHKLGIVHRDVKPANIFLLKEASAATVKLLDFGIAKLLHEENPSFETSTNQLPGSPHYMSPEQCRGHEVDHRSDVYSLGLVAYEMLTGHRAFNAEALGELLLQQQTQDVTLPVDDSLPWPPAVEAALQRALHKDPAQRYDHPSELAEALASAVGSHGDWAEVAKGPYEADPGLEQHESFFHTRTIRGKRSHKTIVALVVGLVCVGIAGVLAVVLGISSWGEEEPQTGDRPDAASAQRTDGEPAASRSKPGTQHRPFEVTIDVAAKRRRRPRPRHRPKKRPTQRKTKTKTKTKTKRPEVVPGEPVRF